MGSRAAVRAEVPIMNSRDRARETPGRVGRGSRRGEGRSGRWVESHPGGVAAQCGSGGYAHAEARAAPDLVDLPRCGQDVDLDALGLAVFIDGHRAGEAGGVVRPAAEVDPPEGVDDRSAQVSDSRVRLSVRQRCPELVVARVLLRVDVGTGAVGPLRTGRPGGPLAGVRAAVGRCRTVVRAGPVVARAGIALVARVGVGGHLRTVGRTP